MPAAYSMTGVPVDPDVLALLAELGRPAAAADLTPPELRLAMHDAMAVFNRGAAPIAVDTVRDEFVAGRQGSVLVRVYSPEHPAAVIVYLHGGGWVVGDCDTHDVVARRLCRDTDAVVVSVDYRRAPEDPFPAQLDDTCSAVAWSRDLHPGLPLLMAGDSAGGTLAVCAALRMRDEGVRDVDALVLIYPVVDQDFAAPSVTRYAGGPRLTRADLEYYLDAYLPADMTDAGYALPGLAPSLKDLPPTVLSIAGHDLLRSSEESFGRTLKVAGVPVTVQMEPALIHGWIDFAARVPAADAAFGRLTDAVVHLIERVP